MSLSLHIDIYCASSTKGVTIMYSWRLLCRLIEIVLNTLSKLEWVVG